MVLAARTDHEVDVALSALSREEGASRDEIIRRAVRGRFERLVHSANVKTAAMEMIDRWRDVHSTWRRSSDIDTLILDDVIGLVRIL